jgi:GT2 family glycosyltransferase
MMPFVSIVIPTFNRRSTLEHVLPLLVKQTYPADRYEILLSDSGSTDGTREMVESMGIPNLRLVTGENKGRSGARNRGIQEAKGEIVLFTDADILADEGLVEAHARTHMAQTGIAMVGCEVQVNTLDEYNHVKGHPEARRHLHGDSAKDTSWLFFLTGNASARRDDLIEVGMFDEGFTGYGHEDLELGYRLRKKGLRIRYNPAALNYHWHPVSFDERCSRKELSGVSTIRFYRKHRDLRIKLLLGVNPLTVFLHRFVSPQGWVLRYCRKRTGTSGFCRDVVLQFHYLTGVRRAQTGK